MGNPLAYYDNNVKGTLNRLHVMTKHNVRKIVFSSSCTVYGQEGTPPYRETDPLRPVCPYGRTKLIIEEILTNISRADNCCSVVLLRYFNPIHAHESGLLGDDPKGVPNCLIPFLAQVAVRMRPELNGFDNDCDTADGTSVPDYIQVIDIIEGNIKALIYCLGHVGMEAVNLGPGIRMREDSLHRRQSDNL
jgi:UDP-glucose 4-epimerase